MSAGTIKRSALLLAGVAALLPLAALSKVAPVAASLSPQRFAPPGVPLVLTRTVVRALPGGKEIVVARRYEIRIIADGAGYRVDGALLDCKVSAPPVLAALAQLERQRPENGLFPIRLDRAGRIVPEAPAAPGEALARGSQVAREQISLASLTPTDRRDASAFVRHLATHGAFTAWPADLFHPATGQRSEHKDFALPDGSVGSVAVAIDARATAQGGLLDRVERTVTTRLEGTSRVTREEWTLVVMDGQP